MEVDLPHSNGLRVDHLGERGKVVAAGTVQLHSWKWWCLQKIHMDAGMARGATLYDASGAVVASAIFI